MTYDSHNSLWAVRYWKGWRGKVVAKLKSGADRVGKFDDFFKKIKKFRFFLFKSDFFDFFKFPFENLQESSNLQIVICNYSLLPIFYKTWALYNGGMLSPIFHQKPRNS